MADKDTDPDQITVKETCAVVSSLDIMEAWNSGKPLEIHPAAECFPMLEGDELRELREDIEAHGLQEPIAFLNGALLDGRCRLAAMEPDRPKVDENNINIFIKWLPDDTDPINYVVSANSHRRHLRKKILADQIVERLMQEMDQPDPISDKRGRGNKNPLKQEAIEEGKKLGVSEGEIKRSMQRKSQRTKSGADTKKSSSGEKPITIADFQNEKNHSKVKGEGFHPVPPGIDAARRHYAKTVATEVAKADLSNEIIVRLRDALKKEGVEAAKPLVEFVGEVMQPR